jgi:hypothetical protein
VLNTSIKRSIEIFNQVRRAGRPMTSVLLSLGLGFVGLPNALAFTPAESVVSQQTSTPALATRHSIPDGVYLYGQADEPQQIGSAYMVFEVQQNQVVGAFYMPQSSFDCFSGEFQADQLALNVVDSYEQTVHPYAVALEAGAPIASATGEAIAPAELEGFHRLDEVSEADQTILATCQADLQPQS